MADEDGWQRPRHTVAPNTTGAQLAVEEANPYAPLMNLPEPEDPGPVSPTPSYKHPKRAKQATPAKPADKPDEPAIEAQQVFDRPHQASYFIPGRIEGRPAQFLLDTGCTTNLIGKHMFDKLPEHLRATKEEYTRHGLLADGTRLPFYGIIRLDVRLRQVKTREVFVISQINEDAILGMPFLVERRCSMDFSKPVLRLDGQEVKCTDRQGRLLTNHIQAIRRETLPPRSEKTILCRVTSRNFCPLGMVEALPEGVPVATSLNRPNQQGQLVVRCLNPSEQPIELKSGTVIGTYTSVEEQEVEDRPPTTNECSTSHEIPGHVKELFDSARRNCKSTSQEEQLASLLRKYRDVFSSGEEDVGLTSLVQHSIPIAPDTRPIRQPPHRLGPEKEAEAERQVQDLLEKGLIEPASGA